NSSRSSPMNNLKWYKVSVSTVKGRLRAPGLTGRVGARKPLLRRQNKTERLAWAMKHHHWTTEDWKKVLWTNESKFEIFMTGSSSKHMKTCQL
uniref:Transposase Tc1-like domain-containing protein n=1 Tax=Oreochromis aureus TaxID=47969 RepID=A0AAZ1X5G4_OREAU